MKKLKLPAWVLILVLVAAPGCARQGDSSDAALLEFPGAPWGSTPQAVLDALDLQDSQILYNEETTSEASPEEASADERTWVLIAQDLDYLGATSHYAKFTFNQYDGEEQFGLYDVQLCFPDGTDMAALQARMIAQYGPGSQDKPAVYHLIGGRLTRSTLNEKEPGAHWLYWTGDASPAEYLDSETQAHLLDFYEHNESNPVSREVTAEWLEKETLTEISWSDDANALLRDKHESITANEVHFSGVMLRFLQFTGSGM